MALHTDDMTPDNFVITEDSLGEKVKKLIRRTVYPIYLKSRKKALEKNYAHVKDIGFDELFLGQRGNDYDAHRRRVNKIKSIEGSTVLILGIGTGRDLESWLRFNPKKIIAVDYFNYEKAWNKRKEQYKDKYDTKIEFVQSDIIEMKKIKDNSIDIIGSDAVFEHINKFHQAIDELKRVLKVGGILYSNFGPLWYSWGGDHISGSDEFVNGYNHISLEKDAYESYLDGFGEFTHSENDGRTWIRNNLFSYLKPNEYLDIIGSKLNRKYVSCIIDENAVKFKLNHNEKFENLAKRHREENLIVSGITIIYEK